MPDLNDQYQARHLRNIANSGERIRLIFDGAIMDISLTASLIRYRGGVFSLDRYPLLYKRVQEVLARMRTDITVEIVNSMREAWDLSNEKNDLFVDRRLAGKKPSEGARQVLYDPNLKARNAFISRKEKGLDLSGRVWDLVDGFKNNELERGLGIGISEGQSAAEMARDLKQYLREPDRLFRRVRAIKGDKNSPLRLSKAAQSYNPGRGVYRSSFQNAKRLTRTETNGAYRAADHERWQRLPFVKGIEVCLSNRHPEYDMCDHLKGQYPASFHFSGWHPQCLCSAIPVLMNSEEYSKMEDYTLGLTDKAPQVDRVQEIPASAAKWMKDNAERVNGWKSQPYWAKNNPGFVGDLLKGK